MWGRWIKFKGQWHVSVPRGTSPSPGDVVAITNKSGQTFFAVLGPRVGYVQDTEAPVYELATTVELDLAAHLLSRLARKIGFDMTCLPSRAKRKKAQPAAPRFQLLQGGAGEGGNDAEAACQ